MKKDEVNHHLFYLFFQCFVRNILYLFHKLMEKMVKKNGIFPKYNSTINCKEYKTQGFFPFTGKTECTLHSTWFHFPHLESTSNPTTVPQIATTIPTTRAKA